MKRASVVLTAGSTPFAIARSGPNATPLEDEEDGGGAADGERLLRALRGLSAS